MRELAQLDAQIASFGVDADGEVYLLRFRRSDSAPERRRLIPRPADSIAVGGRRVAQFAEGVCRGAIESIRNDRCAGDPRGPDLAQRGPRPDDGRPARGD